MTDDPQISRYLLQDWIVVVVDDDPISLEVAEVILAYYGATVLTAENGSDGVSIIRHHQPRLIIADLSMPVMDGWEMIAKLKGDRVTSDIPIIALTAHAMVGDRERALAAGCHNYLTKPLTPATFIRDLAQVLFEIPELAPYLTQ
jgi:CheY-like chemotaxis protein